MISNRLIIFIIFLFLFTIVAKLQTYCNIVAFRSVKFSNYHKWQNQQTTVTQIRKNKKTQAQQELYIMRALVINCK
ncbi:MAG: hypothetical protein ACI8XB_001647 [Patiriisocius sp.]|jgi:hypothetical protein